VLNPDISEANLPANFVTWTGGEAVEGHQLQRRVSKGSSAHTQMIAGCGSSSATGDAWIVWADVTVRHTGNKTVYEAGTDTGNDKEFPYFCPGTSLGATNRLGESPKYLGWIVEIKGDITPAGIHDVVSSGWDFYQTVTYIDFLDNTNVPSASATNAIDTAFNSSTYQDQTPDPNDEIFALDGPGLLAETDFNYAKTTDNFRVRVRWNEENASDEAQWWTRQKAEKIGENYTVIENSGGNGTTTIDNFY
jgi:hypothetical protein